MSMSRREKVLGIITVALLLVFGIVLSTFMLSGAGFSSSSSSESFESNVEILRRKKQKAEMASELLAKYESFSLPADPNAAERAYETWVIGKSNEYFEKVDVKPIGKQPRGDVYNRIALKVNGDGDIEELTRFMHDFYSVNILHRIRELHVTPKEDSKDLDLFFICEAVSIMPRKDGTTVDRKSLEDVKTSSMATRFGAKSSYEKVVLGRNLFSLPNREPKFKKPRISDAVRGKSISETLLATDDDELDTVTISEEFTVTDSDGKPVEVSPDDLTSTKPGTANFRWRPDKAGTYTVHVSAADDGFPKKTVRMSFDVVVKEPRPPVKPIARPTPPKRPSFDVAKVTVLTAILQELDGTLVVWLDPKNENRDEPYQFTIDDKIEFGTIEGKILEIDGDHMIVESNGKKVQINVGEPLSEAKPVKE